MDSIANAVQGTSRMLVPAQLQMSSVAWKLFKIFHKAHKFVLITKIYTKSDNFYHLLAGSALTVIPGANNSTTLKFIAQFALLMDRIQACIDQQIVVYQSFQKMHQSFCGNFFPLSHKNTESKPTLIFSPSTGVALNEKIYRICGRIAHIFWNMMKLLGNIFELSMNFMDAVDAGKFDPDDSNEAVRQVFVNFLSSINHFVAHQERLLETLKEKRQLIGDFLSGIGSKLKPEDFENAISSSLRFSRPIQTVANAGGGKVKDFLYRATVGAITSLQVSNVIDMSLLPQPAEKQEVLMTEQQHTKPRQWKLSSRNLQAST